MVLSSGLHVPNHIVMLPRMGVICVHLRVLAAG
jgi:hypothetical protein